MMRRDGKPTPGIRALLGLACVAIALAAARPLPAAAHSYKFGDIAVGHVWVPPVGQDAEGVPVYGPLLNRGKTPDSLVAASSPIAARVRFRVAKDGKTSWPDSIPLPPGRPLGLAPWRVHLWLMGLKRPLKDGDRFDVTLTFAHAGTHTVQVLVERTAGH
jgi:periplasmic copper chaperone A